MERCFEELHPQVSALIRHAAEAAILPRFRRLEDGDISEKTPGEIVTIADHQSEEILSRGLASILHGSRILGEEACTAAPELLADLDQGLLWIVDPLDGTPNFVAGNPPFGIIVALAEEGETIAGWLYDPLAERLCFATKDGGAWLSHGGGPAERLRTREPDSRPIASLATQFMPPEVREPLIRAAEESFELLPIPRCAAEHYPRLCLCENDVAMFQRTLPWDHAAGALLLTEAGGHVARWDGSPYHFHDDRLGILAATSDALWNEAASVLFEDGLLGKYGRTIVAPHGA